MKFKWPVKSLPIDPKDRWILGGASLALLTSSFLIVDNSWVFRLIKKDRSQLTQVAQFTQVDNDVRRRTESEIAFLPIAPAQEIYQGDHIFTGTESKAELQFKNGSKIDVEPKSLISIQVLKNAPSIGIDQGTVSGKLNKNQKLNITIQGHASELTGSDALVEVTVNREGTSQVTVLSGTANLKSAEGSVSIQKNESTEIHSNGALGMKKSFQVELLNPTLGQKIWKQEKDPIELKWALPNLQNDVSNLLEIAKDRAFKSLVSSVTLNKQRTFIYTTSENGILFWRITAGESISPISYFEVGVVQAPELLEPAPQTKFSLKKNIKESGHLQTQVNLTWKDPLSQSEASSPSEVQVATDPEFKVLKFHAQVQHPHCLTDALPAGHYYWKIKTFFPNSNIPISSSVSSFQIVEEIVSIPGSVIHPTAPSPTVQPSTQPSAAALNEKIQTLLPPSDGISPKANQVLEIDSQNPKSLVHFKWNPVQNAKNYEIQISNTSNFSRIVSQTQIETPFYETKELPLGHLYWRIRSVREQTQSSWTHQFAFNRILKSFNSEPKVQKFRAPNLVFPVGRVIQRTSGEYPFQWEKIEGAQSYELTLNREPHSQRSIASGGKPLESPEVQKFKVSRNTLTLALPEKGRYTWSVRALSSTTDLATDEAQSLSSKVNFELTEPKVAKTSPTRLNLVTLINPSSNQLNLTLPSLSSTVPTSYTYGAIKLSGETWLSPRWGLGLDLEAGLLSLNSAQASIINFNLFTQYAVFKEEVNDWHLAPAIGFTGRQFPDLFSSQASAFTTLGGSLSLTVRKTFWDHWELGGNLNYYVPIVLLGSSGGSASLTHDQSYRNFSASLQGTFWINSRLGANLGGTLDLRSISYTTPSATGTVELSLDGTFVFGGLTYRF